MEVSGGGNNLFLISHIIFAFSEDTISTYKH